MSRIGEALNKAAREKGDRAKDAAFLAQTPLRAQNPAAQEGLAGKNMDYAIKTSIDSSDIDPSVVAYFDPNSNISEQYRSLRTNILLNNSSRPLKTMVVCSSLEGEGKTTTAVNLAITMTGDLEKSILLVDCDLRAGTIHQLLSVKPSVGLSDVLAGAAEPELALYQTKVNNLTVLPRGEIPSNPSELLSSRKMRVLLEELKSKFDYIILDSPPIIPLTDACVISSQVDGVIFVVQAHRTPRRLVKQAQNMLVHVHAKIMGLVFTQMEVSERADRYGYHKYVEAQKSDLVSSKQTEEEINEI